MGATTNNLHVQVAALRDLGALPADADVEAVIRDLGLDRPPVDPTTLTADEMVDELRDVTKALLGYGARLPKELMLFVKDILFLNGAMATMAPDVDILGEILAVVSYFTEHHGERIAREVGRRAGREPDRPRRLPRRPGVRRGDRSDHLPRPPGAQGADPPPARAARRAPAQPRSFLRALDRVLRPPDLRARTASRWPGRTEVPPSQPASRARRRDDTKVAAASGPRPSSSRLTRADPTTTPSATSQTVTAWAGVETPMPTQTGSSVTAVDPPATCRAESASTACSPVTPMRPTA